MYKAIYLLLILLPLTTFGQLTKIRGRIIDKTTQLPLPFVNISFKGTALGVISDIDGKYYIETRTPTDSIAFSYMGYMQELRPVKKGQFQEINAELTPTAISLQEVVIKPGKNPALILLDSLNAHRDKNNPNRLEYWEAEVYNKMEFDVSNIDDKFRKNPLFKQFQFIFDYTDTSVISGKTYLPVMISETVSELYYQKNPQKEKEIIKATNISGIKNDQVTQFTGQMYLKVNPYNNFIQLFGKGFVSPIASFGPLYYKYYLVDSAYLNNRWCYQISYLPRRAQEPTFTGDFWIHDTTFAISKINARMATDANLNFIYDLTFNLEYQFIGDSIWFTSVENTFIDFNISDKTYGLLGNKTTSYKNIVLGQKRDAEFYNPRLTRELIILDNVNNVNKTEWKQLRHLNLTEKELNIYGMVDSIKQIPVFQTWVDVVKTVVNGHFSGKYFEIGPFYKFYSFNAIEGNRFRFGGRTSKLFSKKLLLNGHIAFGEKDQKIKFAHSGIYSFQQSPYIAFGWNIAHDIEQLGISQNAFTQDNILSSFLRRTYNKKLTMVDEAKIFFTYEWFQGLSNTITINTRQIWSTEYVPFIITHNNTTETLKKLNSTEIKLNTRYAYNETYLFGRRRRVRIGARWPILNIDFSMGLKNILGSRYQYYVVHASVQHDLIVNPIGRLKYIIDGGMYFGNTPYPLLQLHQGNETYAYDNYAFNMMNYYEFVSDRYFSVFAEHHFDGLFFNRIPLFRKLKWREVVSAKGLIGSISKKNIDQMQFPEGLRGLTVPYGEASVGVENILKMFRIDAMWRLSYLSKPPQSMHMPDIPKFGIRVNLRFEF